MTFSAFASPLRYDGGMAAHVAILKKPYIRLILEGRKTVESRLTKTNRPPFGMIQPNDRIYLKCSAGPYMAVAVAGAIDSHDQLTPRKIQAVRRKYDKTVCGHDEYWASKRDSRYATFIELLKVKPTDTGPPLAPSSGPAWFVCQPDLLPQSCQATLTGGAVRNCYVRVPAVPPDPDAPHALRPIELLMPDGRVVRTDIRDNGLIRWRGWGDYFRRFGVQADDKIGFERASAWRYRVLFACEHKRKKPAMTRPTETPADEDPRLSEYISQKRLEQLIRQAKAEDMGPPRRDITTDCLIPARASGRAALRARQKGVLAGCSLLAAIARCYDPDLVVSCSIVDGQALKSGSAIAHVDGSLRSILTMERVALNFVTHLSGIATLTAEYVRAVAGTRARIYDTRKTLPGLRGLEKYAVACGGGESHRIGLYDAMLVKDNHIAHIPADELPTALNDAIAKARRRQPAPRFVEVEVDTLKQLELVLSCAIDVVLLDNMDANELRQAVAIRDKHAPKVQLEASGGITLENVAKIARTGVDRISVGAITHSAPSLDLGLDILK